MADPERHHDALCPQVLRVDLEERDLVQGVQRGAASERHGTGQPLCRRHPGTSTLQSFVLFVLPLMASVLQHLLPTEWLHVALLSVEIFIEMIVDVTLNIQ